MLQTSTYLEAIRRESAALAEAARGGIESLVPSCPGWTVGTLVMHMAGIYAHRVKIVDTRAQENTLRSFEDFDIPAEYKKAFDAAEADMPVTMPGVVGLFEEETRKLLEVFEAADPTERVWTWWPPDQTVGFWIRRMAHETAVHRWDAQLAHGQAEPIGSELARDGIDEYFDVMLPVRKSLVERGWMSPPRASAGEAYHFHRTDGEGEWLVRFEGDTPTVTHEHGRGDVAVRGSASDLLLFLWHRIPADRLEILGDRSLIDRYFELVPPD